MFTSYNISLEDLNTIIVLMQDTIKDDERRQVLVFENTIMLLQEARQRADAITWLTGYEPKVNLSDEIVQGILLFKVRYES